MACGGVVPLYDDGFVCIIVPGICLHYILVPPVGFVRIVSNLMGWWCVLYECTNKHIIIRQIYYTRHVFHIHYAVCVCVCVVLFLICA